MKKVVLVLTLAFSLPLGMLGQNYNDDLYFNPSKDKEEKAPVKKEAEKKVVTTTIYTTPGTTVVVKDRKGNTRDVDEYNRRYDSRDNEFVMENDTLVIKEKRYTGLDGEWVSEFEGSEDDLEYAERIIRFRNPRFAISISSPMYWDVVYGLNSWDWNVYTDGFYAYAFPTFSNRMWWDWRFNSYGWGGYPSYGYGGYYGGWGGYYGGYYAGWGGCYPGYWGGGWGGYYGYHGYHGGGYYPGYWGGGSRYSGSRLYTDRRSGSFNGGRSSSDMYSGRSTAGRSSAAGRSFDGTSRSSARSYQQEGVSTTRRVVGTRSSADRQGTVNLGTDRSRVGGTTDRSSAIDRNDASSRRSSVYTRPSSTRPNATYEETRRSIRDTGAGAGTGSSRSSSSVGETSRSSTYSRGSSTAPARSYSTEGSSRSSSRSSSPSYTPSSSSRSSSSSSYSSGSSSSGSSYSSGSSSRSSSSGSSGGGSSRSSRR